MQEKRTLSGWANMQQIRLLDLKYYDDNNLYSYEEYRKIVPRNVGVPMAKPEISETSVIDINNLIVKKEDNYQLADAIVSELKLIDEQEKRLKETKEELKQNILSEMESKNILKLETDDLTITYIAPAERETFDSKKFREENSDLYDEYVKFSPVKSSIRIKVK